MVTPNWSHTTKLNFMSIVDMLLPSTIISTKSSRHFQFGGQNLLIWEYLLISLDSLPQPLSDPTSQLLDISAYYTVSPPYFFNGYFSSLSRNNRIKTITALEDLQVPLDKLPFPYQNNPTLIKIMINSLYQITLFGYYSEWTGYLYTRYYSPSYRQLLTFPLGWIYSGYPGPSYGYRDFRGFLLKMEKTYVERDSNEKL
ncbi:hypothetical protein IMZ08_13885 [Bacillus luteolus]|uniref:Uncharacterized protein n=1 Tax=Litchfieldia luteola TaxID=682179 RepID=A0ABR9QKW9_9BACI|nr:hypothetical protein [Cytobacillus luteolus]MBE4909153.1 hypothetical protein [Cytobacillus luteolus]MBP1940395.1 hypothetical protein [Cytobacillus luteolus]